MTLTLLSILYCWIWFALEPNTPIGYITVLCFGVIAAESSQLFLYVPLILFISVCFHQDASYKMFRHLLRQLESFDKNLNNGQILQDLIQSHMAYKKFFFTSARIYRFNILSQLVCSVITLAVVIFHIDRRITDFNADVVYLLFVLYVRIVYLFLYCYFGKLATDNYKKMADSLYESNWQDLPVNLQKFFVFMIGKAARPLQYDAFGITALNLETYTRIPKAVYSYYMAFKSITSK